jgi:hypothetical protein
MGKSLESRQPVEERFQIMPWPGRPILGEGRLNRKTGELENDGIYRQYYVGVALLRQE